jgi:hypothetical protein
MEIDAVIPLAFAAAPSLGAPIPNVRLTDSKCQFFGVLFTFFEPIREGFQFNIREVGG